MDFDKHLEDRLVEYLATTSVTKASIPVVANELGVSIPELQEALSKPALKKRLQSLASAQALLYAPASLHALAAKADEGDVKAAATILQQATNEDKQDAPTIKLTVEGLRS